MSESKSPKRYRSAVVATNEHLRRLPLRYAPRLRDTCASFHRFGRFLGLESLIPNCTEGTDSAASESLQIHGDAAGRSSTNSRLNSSVGARNRDREPLWTPFSNERRTILRNKSTALDPRCRSTFSATAAIISNPRVIWSLDINLSRKPLYLDSHGFPHQSHRLIPPPWRWATVLHYLPGFGFEAPCHGHIEDLGMPYR